MAAVQALACSVIAWTHALRGELSEAIEVAGRGLTLSGDPMTSSLLSGAMATQPSSNAAVGPWR